MSWESAYSGATGLGGWLLVRLNRVRAHEGSLDLISSRERMLKTFKVTREDDGLWHLPVD